MHKVFFIFGSALAIGLRARGEDYASKSLSFYGEAYGCVDIQGHLLYKGSYVIKSFYFDCCFLR